MSALPGRRSGIAILRVEIEELEPERVLIRLTTLDEVLGAASAEDCAFASPTEAIHYLRDWLQSWMLRG